MGLNMKAIGIKTINMDMEFKLGLMEANMREITDKEKNMGKVNIHGRMGVIMMEIGNKIRLMDMEFIFGEMAESI